MTAVHRSTVQGKALSDTTGGCSGTHLFDSHDLSRVLVLCLIHSSKLRGGRGERKRETGVTTAEWRPAAPSRQAQRRRLELGLLQRHCGGRRSPAQTGPARPAQRPPRPPATPQRAPAATPRPTAVHLPLPQEVEFLVALGTSPRIHGCRAEKARRTQGRSDETRSGRVATELYQRPLPAPLPARRPALPLAAVTSPRGLPNRLALRVAAASARWRGGHCAGCGPVRPRLCAAARRPGGWCVINSGAGCCLF